MRKKNKSEGPKVRANLSEDDGEIADSNENLIVVKTHGKKTLCEIIKEIDLKSNLTSNQRKSIRKESLITNRTQRTNSESLLNQKRERSRLLRPKLVLQENGEFVIEQPKLSDVNEHISSISNLTATNEQKEKLTSMSFRKRSSTKKWTKDDTELFYKSLECFGTDLSLYEYIFKGRNRNQIKKKLKREEKINSDKIKNHLSSCDNDKLKVLIPILTSIYSNTGAKGDSKELIKSILMESTEELREKYKEQLKGYVLPITEKKSSKSKVLKQEKEKLTEKAKKENLKRDQTNKLRTTKKESINSNNASNIEIEPKRPTTIYKPNQPSIIAKANIEAPSRLAASPITAGALNGVMTRKRSHSLCNDYQPRVSPEEEALEKFLQNFNKN